VRAFAQRGPHLRKLPVEARLVYTVFALFSLAGLVVTTLLYQDMLGLPGGARSATYYGGAAPAAEPIAEPDPGGGPDLELPGDGPDIELPGDEPAAAAPAPIVVQMSTRKLLEVTHFHLFTAPVFFLIIAHLFLLSGVRSSVQIAIIGLAAASLAAHLAAPAIIRAADGGGAWLMPVSGLVMGVTFTLMTLWPAVAMWLPLPRRERPAS
jgi:hypothetical protein